MLRLASTLLLATGLTLLGFWASSRLESRMFQKSQARRLEAIQVESARARAAESGRDSRPDSEDHPAPVSADISETAAPFFATHARAEARRSGLVGRVEIPRLELSGMIGEGMEEKTLKHAVGHIPRTAFPGEPGNFGLAAHRDTFFRKLRNVALGDTIRVTIPDGLFHYVVDSLFIVLPEQVEILYPTPKPVITLVTCYPFNYVGRAPKRFIVRGHSIDPVGSLSPELLVERAR